MKKKLSSFGVLGYLNNLYGFVVIEYVDLWSGFVLANLEAKLDALYGQFERLVAANGCLTDMMLGRVVDLEESDSVGVVGGQKILGDYVR